MLILAEYSQQCPFESCKYNLQTRCGLNVKTENSVITRQCRSSDDWYITGSFVLDCFFDKTTANDIDVVARPGEMPAQLPNEVLNSPLRIEMLWLTPEQEAIYQCYNLNLPRITAGGLMHEEVGASIKKNRLISVLPRKRKLAMLSICIAIKPMVKYRMKPDERTISLWIESIRNPPNLKKEFASMLRALPIESTDWTYIRAQHLINAINLAYKDSTENQRKQYLEVLKQTLAIRPPDKDVAYNCLMDWLDAVIQGDEKKKKATEKYVLDRRWKLRRPI